MNTMERWAALTQDERDKVLEEHIDINVHHDWWDCVYDGFKEDMSAVGVEVDRMYFSGFSSQGDGACFEGSVADWPKLLAAMQIECPVLAKHAAAHFSFSVEHRGHYYHENCTSFSADLPLPTDEYEDEEHFLGLYGQEKVCELRDAVFIAALSKFHGDDLEAQITEFFKSHMRDLYRRLEEEHDHLTSDEAVLDSLVAAELLDDIIDEINQEKELELA